MAAYNSTYTKRAVHCLNHALKFYQSLCLSERELIINQHLLVDENRYTKKYNQQ